MFLFSSETRMDWIHRQLASTVVSALTLAVPTTPMGIVGTASANVDTTARQLCNKNNMTPVVHCLLSSELIIILIKISFFNDLKIKITVDEKYYNFFVTTFSPNKEVYLFGALKLKLWHLI